MKSKTIWIIVGVVVLLIVFYFVVKAVNKNKDANALGNKEVPKCKIEYADGTFSAWFPCNEAPPPPPERDRTIVVVPSNVLSSVSSSGGKNVGSTTI